MGKKNRNRGSSRGRYDDMFDYAGGNDEDYQYSYQDEIDSAEFVDVGNSPKDSHSRETMPPSEKNTKSQAAEERESWDFIKAKMDQSLSKLGVSTDSAKRNEKTEKASADPSKEEKEKKPKGPSAFSVFLGKLKSSSSTAFQKLAASLKRKPKPEKKGENSGKNAVEKKAVLSGKDPMEKKTVLSGKDSTEKKADVPGKDKTEKKSGISTSVFSFWKKKTETAANADKATRKKNETPNSSGESKVSQNSKPSPESKLRERRKTYLIIGAITMCIVALLLTAGILFIVNYSGKSTKSVAQNMETAAQIPNSAETSGNDGSSLPDSVNRASASQSNETGKEVVPPSLDSELLPPGLIDEPANTSGSKTGQKTEKKKEDKKAKKENKNGKTESEIPLLDDPSSDLTVGDVVNSDAKNPENSMDLSDLDSLVNESETTPTDENDPSKTQAAEEKSADSLPELDPLTEFDTSGNESENAPESGDPSNLASLAAPTVETDPSKTNNSANATMQEETPSLNETATLETEGEDSAGESSLLELPESVSPGSTSVSPTLSRSEDQNQPPEEMGTPDGVNPGSNIESWNTPGNGELADSGLSGNSFDLNAPGTDPLNEKDTKTTSENDDLMALTPSADPPLPNTSQPKESDSGGIGDFGQLSDLDSSPTPTPSLDSDLGTGISSPPTETSNGQKSAKYTNYTTSKDDTFWKISEKFYQTPAYEKALSRYNIDVVPDPNNLKEGTVLQIPDVNFLRSCYPTLCPQPLQVVQVPTSQNSNQTRGVQYYCAMEGDTLSLIAERLLGDSSRWPEIYRLNTDKVRDMDLLPSGVKLLIPVDDDIPEQNIWQ